MYIEQGVGVYEVMYYLFCITVDVLDGPTHLRPGIVSY
jgi:hypothetical protein